MAASISKTRLRCLPSSTTPDWRRWSWEDLSASGTILKEGEGGDALHKQRSVLPPARSVVLFLYSSLAVFFATCAWASGWQSGGTVWLGLFAAFFGGIVYQEVRYCITGVHAVYRR